MTLTVFTLLSFAAYRASRAIALDTITEPARDWLDEWSLGKAWPKRKVYELVSCGWCIGFWLAGLTVFVYLAVTGSMDDEPVLINLMLWWAVAGGQSLLVAVDSFLLREAPPDE